MKTPSPIRFLNLPGKERIFFLSLLWLTLLVRIITLFPFRMYENWIVKLPSHMHEPVSEEEVFMEMLLRSVRRIEKYFSVISTCLVTAVTVKKFLQSYGKRSILKMGVKKDDGSLKAHAWLIYNDTVITGGMQSEQYNELYSL